MIVISSGKSYLDIDGFASCIAYRELLKLRGVEAKFVSSGKLNSSITPSLIALGFKTDDYIVKENDKFIILDTSNKDYFEEFIKEDNIIEIIDHHPGYEDYWNKLIDVKSHIESIGAIATIMVEKYEKYDLLDKINDKVARLLMGAILDNTLNFTANITSDRDRVAYQKLETITHLKNFDKVYFKECESSIVSNLEETIRNDIKIEKNIPILPDVLGQLLIYDIKAIMDKINIINDTMSSYGSNWLLNIISLRENKSYILYSNEFVKKNLEELFNIKANDNFIIVQPNILRKELMKKTVDFGKEE